MTAVQKTDADDDGRVVADMSGLAGLGSAGLPGVDGRVPERSVREELSGASERRALIFGATWAGLSIGLVYIVAFGLAILVLLALWR